MPEGDILRRAARTLDAALAGQRLVRAELRWPSAAGVDLVGATVLGTVPYGKHLFTRFDDGRSLHTHLRMEGSWRLVRTGTPAAQARSPWVRAVLATAEWTAAGHRLGMLDVLRTEDEHTVVGHLGPDVLADDFPGPGLAEALRRVGERGDVPIAEVLLDQRVCAGIGTLYAAESLYARRLWPWTPAGQVTDVPSLLMTARRLMERSVASPTPTAIGDGPRGLTSWVHDRAGQPCLRCGTPVVRGVARRPPMERPIFYCPTCQVGR
ncbi:DNA glycosylase [Actinotalea ferrariae CF5-4]|uniref:DNA-(apurinic or apyrimidinic site) lyase n=1 Tax=Actinotalea ferrariae CF5-4 TaxID=948458 RepID=A0A021VKZ4_9CELL|nr:DNA-formamidopyrimidine glycosylase family protein [Actinotalea ferrariae]EYR61854.1 DNA glycosylase [Actinotalea ferrariae CF5-4]